LSARSPGAKTNRDGRVCDDPAVSGDPAVPDRSAAPTVPDRSAAPTVPDRSAAPTVPDRSAAPTVPDRSTPLTRWERRVTGERWQVYADRFARHHAEGADLAGEARFVDALVPRRAAVLDAGCGTGRVAAALVAAGHRAVGVDKDAGLLAIARERYPGVPYLESDLLALDPGALRAAGVEESFDLVVMPGNVLVYVAPGTERAVLDRLASLTRPGGRIVTGFATDREYRVADLDADAAALGLTVEYRFATWQLDPFAAGSDWAVTILRRPSGGVGDPS
jgi:SAM-dependent methyltransferase